MKKLVLVVLVLFLAVTTAYAQPEPMIQLVVPFAFHAQDTHAAAGEYLVRYLRPGYNTLVLLNKDSLESLAVLTFKGDELQSRQVTPKLVFHKYGDEYFLVSMTMPNRLVQQLPESKSEREVVTHQVITKLHPETVTIFGNSAK